MFIAKIIIQNCLQ